MAWPAWLLFRVTSIADDDLTIRCVVILQQQLRSAYPRWRRAAILSGLVLIGAVGPTASAAGWPDVFNPRRVLNLHLQMDPGDWSAVQNDTSLTTVRPAQFWAEDETPIAVTVKRKSDPAIGPKVSLKIDVNELVPGQTWRGVKKLSLENGNGGNSIVREGFAWQLHRLASENGFYKHPSAYAAWVRLYVNGEQIGVYTHAEERDKQMLQNRGMWKEGATWLYKYDPNPILEAGVTNQPSPTLEHLCYLPFANSCTQSNIEADLPGWVDMQGMLTFAALEAFIGNLDGLFTHNAKNCFAVDFAPPTQLPRLYLPWDLDTGLTSVNFNIYTGGPQGGNSLYQQHILGHPWFRNWFRNTMNDLLDGPLSTASVTALLNEIEPVLVPVLDADPNSGLGGAAAGEFESIRQWFTNRIANVRGQVGSIIGAPRFIPTAGEVVAGAEVILTHTNTSGTIYFTLDGTDPRGFGGTPAGIAYTTPLILAETTPVLARVRSGTNWSALRQATFNVANHAAAVRVMEIMYAPRPATTNDDGGEYEFIELQNLSGAPVNLSGCHFDGVRFEFPAGTILAPSNHCVLVRNAVAFTNRYPGVGYQGIYWGAMESNGETIRLKNSDQNNVFSARYNNKPPWPLGANKMGWSLVNQNPAGDPDDPETWRASANVHGSPGANDPAPSYGVGAIIHEVLTHTDPPLEDAIEIYNPTTNDIDISGWYLSDKANFDDPVGAVLKRYLIPSGTVLPSGSFAMFYEGAFNSSGNGSNKFALSSLGEQIYLSSASNGTLSGYIAGAEFSAADNGVSFGRHETSAGHDFVTLESLTFGISNAATLAEFRSGAGAVNARPAMGPVVINEIMYHPGSNHTEFLELYNCVTTNIDLTGWRIEGTGFFFPTGTVIGASNYLVLFGTTNVAEANLRNLYDVPIDVPVLLGSFDLSNSGEKLLLQKPNPDSTNAPIIVDFIRFNDRGPWPTEADGIGPSLERISRSAYGNEPLSWRTLRTGGSPGRETLASNVIAIASGSAWKHHFKGRELGAVWRGTNYSDSGWTTDYAPLGRGYSFIRTSLTNSDNPTDVPVTTYFRKAFVVADNPTAISTLTFRVQHDDGFVAYLNGTEILRRSMVAGSLTSTNLAFPHVASVETVDVTGIRNQIQRGRNILAVELHQSATNDAMLVWDAELTYALRPSTVVETAPFRITAFELGETSLTVEWNSRIGSIYRVEQSQTLDSWEDLSSEIEATNSPTRVTIPAPLPPDRAFLRVKMIR